MGARPLEIPSAFSWISAWAFSKNPPCVSRSTKCNDCNRFFAKTTAKKRTRHGNRARPFTATPDLTVISHGPVKSVVNVRKFDVTSRYAAKNWSFGHVISWLAGKKQQKKRKNEEEKIVYRLYEAHFWDCRTFNFPGFDTHSLSFNNNILKNKRMTTAGEH